jgi:hypothetical protein
MKINEMQLYSAFNEYIDREIIPLGASMDMKEQFAHCFKVGVLKRKIQKLVKAYLAKPEMVMLDIVSEDGNIDVETIYQAAMDAMANVQVVTVAGIDFKSNDIQNLYGIMQRFSS